MWSEGETVVLRDVWFGAVWRALPGRVLEDEPAGTVVWVPRGTENAFPVDDEGREIRLPRRGVRLGVRLTTRTTVVLVRPREPWTLWHFFSEDGGGFDHWYVNLERWLGRGPRSLDSSDHKLDVIVSPDGSVRLKDEDELDHAAAAGLLDAAAVRRDAERVLADPPWPTGWEDFAPDPTWPVPLLPPGWDEL